MLSQTGSVILQVAPSNVHIKVDGQTYLNNAQYEFPIGIHTVEAWKPKHKYEKVQIEVKEGEVNLVKFGLAYSSDYSKFKAKKSQYQGVKLFCRYVMPALGFAISVRGYSSLKKESTSILYQYDNLLMAYDDYYAAGIEEEVKALESSYESKVDRYMESIEAYNKRRSRLIIQSIGIGVVCAGFQLVAFKLKKPKFVEEVKMAYFQAAVDNYTAHGLSIKIPLR